MGKLLAGAGVLGFVVFWGIAGFAWQRDRAERSWPAVQATVVSSGVHESYERATSGSTRSHYYSVDVRYSYQYRGWTYQSTKLGGWSWRTNSRSKVERVVARYAPGSRVKAFVNPGDPGQAVLEPGLSPWIIVTFAMAGVVWAGVWLGIARLAR